MIEANKLSREQFLVDTPEPNEVRLVGFAEDPKYQRRWVLARRVPIATLVEYWRKQCARTGHQARVSSSAGKNLAHKELKAARSCAARSAGWLFASTPDGFVVHLAEFVGAERLGQRYFFLADFLEAAPPNETKLSLNAVIRPAHVTILCSPEPSLKSNSNYVNN